MEIAQDKANLILAKSEESVDTLNEAFYARFPYPGTPMSFSRLDDPGFETIMLNQSIADWTHRRIPESAKIWVTGCGTSQAISTALRFPKASVVGSDFSSHSLEICSGIAASLGINNLVLRKENLNSVTYVSEFDYILCTGVIHHDAVPENTLGRIAGGLKPDGVLELMVYNQFHRYLPSAFQKAVRVLSQAEGCMCDFDKELEIAKLIIKSWPEASRWSLNYPDALLADFLIQPVEHSFTVESLIDLVGKCNLELILPCFNQPDQAANRISWNIQIADLHLRQKIELLGDSHRWQLTNLLQRQRSPMLWFFVGHRGGAQGPRSEAKAVQEFLNLKFIRTATALRTYNNANGSRYVLSPEVVAYPVRPGNDQIRSVVERADGKAAMKDILCELEIDVTNHQVVNEIRVQTTTTLCPYLRSIH